jgi:hypothetical protein
VKKHILVILFAALLLLCACQPTPEEPIVVGKDQTQMIEQARASIAPELLALPIRERLGVPERLNYSYQKGFLSIDADAEIVVPDGELPIVRVFPSDFDQKTVSRLWNVLVDDVPMTAIIDEKTKNDIAQGIEQLLAATDGGNFSECGFESEEQVQKALETLKKQYAAAPDIATGDLANDTLIKGVVLDNEGKEAASWAYLAAESKETGYRFKVSNLSNNTVPIVKPSYDDFGREIGYSIRAVLRSSGFTFIKGYEKQAPCYIWGKELDAGEPCPAEMNGSVTISPQKAKMFAEDFLKAAELDSAYTVQRIFVIRDNESTEFAYRVVCVHKVGGVCTLMTGNEHENEDAAFSADEESYADAWEYETFWIDVNDGGVYCIQLNTPLAIGNTVAEQTSLLPFAEIQKIMEKMLPIMYETETKDYQGSGLEWRFEKHIDRVELGLWRVREQNSIERGLLIPVWAFYANTSERQIGFDDHGVMETYQPILLINAIDGSIIDPARGY